MGGWGKLIAGAVLGVAGTVYATNEELRKHLPGTARDLPVTVRRRFDSAVSAAKEAAASRREEILRDLDRHSEETHHDRHEGRPAPAEAPEPPLEDATQPINRAGE